MLLFLCFAELLYAFYQKALDSLFVKCKLKCSANTPLKLFDFLFIKALVKCLVLSCPEYLRHQ